MTYKNFQPGLLLTVLVRDSTFVVKTFLMIKTKENSALPKSDLEEWIPRASVMQFLGYKATQMYHFLKSGKVKTVKNSNPKINIFSGTIA